MPPARRPRVSSRAPPSSSAVAAGPRSSGKGWLPALRRVHPAKRPRRADDDNGTPFTDEVLLAIFAGVPDLADLVRCATTCRRWRRLVSAEAAALLCRTAPRRPPPDRFVGPLALGFFFHRHENAAALRFVAMAFASRRFPGLLVDDALFDGSSHTLLGLSSEGRLCAIQFGHLFFTAAADRRVSMRVTTRTDCGWDKRELIPVEQSLPEDVANVRLRWFCEKSGIVFFSAIAGESNHRRSEMYALSLKTRVVEKLVSLDGECDPWGQVHGYEMDQATYLASLAELEDTEGM